MIEILYTKFTERLRKNSWDDYFHTLPQVLQEKILRFHRWQDRHAGLFGRLLLRKALTKNGYSANCLENIKLTKYGRPFIDNNFDVNLSHSGEFVVCSVSEKRRVGIDIERIKPVELSDFKSYVVPEKWNEISQSDEKDQLFFDYWTMVESAVKADGRGLSVPIEDLVIYGNEVEFYGKRWFVKKFENFKGYSCNLATTINDPAIHVSEVKF